MRRSILWLGLPLMAACAAMAPIVHPAAVGRPAADLSRLVAASEARLFPCSIATVEGGGLADLRGRHPEVTLLPGVYKVTLECTSGYHTARPQVMVTLAAGKAYRVTGFLVDDSITIFNMRMRAKVTEIAP